MICPVWSNLWGAIQRAEGDNPAVVEGDHIIEKEVCVIAGQVLVEMHVSNWAAAQTEDPVLDAVLCCSDVASLRPFYAPLWLLFPWIPCMLNSQALRPHWNQTNCLELQTSWFFKTTSQNMCWHT